MPKIKEGLTSSFLREFFKKFSKFVGVFSQDQLQDIKLTENQFCIINLDFANETGSHWIGLKLKKKSIEIYDSLGFTSSGWFKKPYFLLKFLLCYQKSHRIFITPHLQHSLSFLCGFYLLYFFSSNKSLANKLRSFSRLKSYNDGFIKNLYHL